MNDLEPWKIWAVTGVLVCAILAFTEARVQPQLGGELSAQASTLTPEQRPTAVPGDTGKFAVQYDAYSIGSPCRSSIRTIYSNSQPYAEAPLSNLHQMSRESSGMANDEVPGLDLDVTQQIFGNSTLRTDPATFDTIDLNSDGGVTWFSSADASGDMFTDVPTDHWAYTAVSDNTATSNLITNLVDGTTTIYLSQAGDSFVRVSNAEIGSAVAQVVLSGDANGSAPLLQALSAAAGQVSEGFSSMGPGEPPSPTDEEGEAEEMLRLKASADAAEAAYESTLQQPVYAEQQAAAQQASNAIRVNLGNMKLQINGVQFTVTPQQR